MVDLLQSASDLGPGFLIGFAQGFLTGASVGIIRLLIKFFVRTISGRSAD